MVIRMAADNPTCPPGDTGGWRASWFGSIIASPPCAVWQILHDAGIDPAPRRSGPTWRQFLTAQAKAVMAVDFLHVDTVFLTRIYALIAVEHGSRRTHLIGLSTHPTGAWTTQAARNLMIDLGDRVTTVKFLLRDRDSRFTGAFDAVFAAEGIRILISPPRATRANAICERMIANPAPRALRQDPHRQRTPLTPHRLPAPFQRSTATPSAGATRTGPDRDPTPTRDQPGRSPDAPQTDP
jgi:hypothetical protein